MEVLVNMQYDYDVIVVGGGHAGMEAALAAAHMGVKTLLISLNIKMMSNMPCNPSIGGSAKGIVVREVDALGGMMGIGADHEYLQMKMLNTGKGPGVQCLRAQEDKLSYPAYMQSLALNTSNLTVKEGMVTSLIHDETKVFGVRLGETEITSKTVILTTGTYMESCILRGHTVTSAGPDGEKPSLGLSPYLKSMGIELFRLKTGTPPRIKADTIDYSKAIPQYGSEGNLAFSYTTNTFKPLDQQCLCWLIYTTPETHKIIRDNIKESAMYSGLITGVGPRYCPSIEDKVVRFSDKDRHQIFIEPEGIHTNEMYVGGMSSSLPEDVQLAMYRTVPGLENCKIVRNAYAIEYDCINPCQLYPTLEFKNIKNLFSGGQFNGSSGYEEAAAQGLIAGINAALSVLNRELITIERSEGYIGVLIDDLVTKENFEPYRMMTSRSEYRLLLRQDNADLRLRKKGYEIGLITKEQYDALLLKEKQIEEEIERLKNTYVGGSEKINSVLRKYNSTELKSGVSLYELIARPELSYESIEEIDKDRPVLKYDVIEQVNINIKYDGYIKRQLKQVEGFAKLEKKKIPKNIDYSKIKGLRIEAAQKLQKYRPVSIGQASRISGVSPADINVLMVYI